MTTVRIWFTKTGESAYISLLDLQRVMSRALKKSKLPCWYSLGFNPHIYTSFTTPLALGQESVTESVDIKTEAEDFDYIGAVKILCDALPRGIKVFKTEKATISPEKIVFSDYEITWPLEEMQKQILAIKKYNDLDEALCEKKTKRGIKTVNLKEYLKEIVFENDKVKLRLPCGTKLNINPELILVFVHKLGGAPFETAKIMRIALICDDETVFGPEK